MRRLRYSSLSDTGLSNSGERPAQRSEAAYCDKESLIWDREEIEVQRKFPAEYRSDSLNAISDDGNRKKIGGVEKERLERENIWLRNRLSAANMKLRELKEQEDRTSGSSCNLSISSNRSSKSKMRCSVLGRKKKKGNRKRPFIRCVNHCHGIEIKTYVYRWQYNKTQICKTAKEEMRFSLESVPGSIPKRLISSSVWLSNAGYHTTLYA